MIRLHILSVFNLYCSFICSDTLWCFLGVCLHMTSLNFSYLYWGPRWLITRSHANTEYLGPRYSVYSLSVFACVRDCVLQVWKHDVRQPLMGIT